MRTGTLLASIVFACAFLQQSCKENDDIGGDPSFVIEGNPTGMTSGVAGRTQNYVVRSNRPWKIVAKDEGNWVKVFPDEGDDDGIFRVIVSANSGFQQRVTNLAFVVDGQEQPVLFRVEQEANVPYINLPEAVTVPSAGGPVTIDVSSNVTWKYSLADNSWLSESSVTPTRITLTAATNNGPERSVALTVTANDHPSVSKVINLVQSPGTIVLEEDFSWLSYGSAVPYTTTGETIITNWTAEQQSRGWTSSLNPVSNDRPCYARQGFVKLGKTSYGGDIISPKLSGIAGTKNVKVTFKAAAYVSAAGTVIDSRDLVIEVLGGGTPSVSLIKVENVPNTQPEDNEGKVNNIWDPARAFTFNISGATAETQIRFLAKAFDLRNETPNTNRIFLDDIKVEIVE